MGSIDAAGYRSGGTGGGTGHTARQEVGSQGGAHAAQADAGGEGGTDV